MNITGGNMLPYYLLRKYRKIVIVLFLLTTFTGGSGDVLLNHLAETGDIYDYTILKAIYEHKEEIKNTISDIDLEGIISNEKVQKVIATIKNNNKNE